MYPFLVILFSFLVVSMLGYFRIADRFNIIDRPNERSSHTTLTIRGGGIIYGIAGVLFAIYSGFEGPWFWAGFFLIMVVSFVDDVKTIGSKTRLPLQLIAVGMMLYQCLDEGSPLWVWLMVLILATGIINAYNFLDGINGITAGYSLIVLLSLFYLNQEFQFSSDLFILTFICADLVFGFFNFRKKARCFAGDVGSVTIAFVIVYLILQLIIKTENLVFIMLLSVYGVDSVLTIIHRITKGENILEAHRSHLYQWMVKPGPFSHLQMSGIYMILQALISMALIFVIKESVSLHVAFTVLILAILSTVYVIVKVKYRKKYELV